MWTTSCEISSDFGSDLKIFPSVTVGFGYCQTVRLQKGGKGELRSGI